MNNLNVKGIYLKGKSTIKALSQMFGQIVSTLNIIIFTNLSPRKFC